MELTGTIRVTPKDGVVWANTSYTTADNQAGFDDISVTTRSVKTPVYLAFEDDVNREGTATGMRFFVDGFTSTVETDIHTVKFADYASMNIDKGFTVDCGLGYDWVADNGPVNVNFDANSFLVNSGSKGNEMWANKKNADNPTNSPATYTVDKPFICTFSNGSGVKNIDTPLFRGDVNQNKTVLSGSGNTAGAIQINYINSDIGWYSVGGGFSYLADSKAITDGRTITVDYDDGGVIVYEPRPAIKRFTADKFVLNEGPFRLNGPSSGGSAVNGNDDYTDRMSILGGADFSGKLITDTTDLGAYAPRNTWFVWYNLGRNGQPYTGSFEYTNSMLQTLVV